MHHFHTNRKSRGLMHLADWVPTLLGLAGVEPPPGEIFFQFPFFLHGVLFSSSSPSSILLNLFFLTGVDPPPGEISFLFFMLFLFLLLCLLLFSPFFLFLLNNPGNEISLLFAEEGCNLAFLSFFDVSFWS